MHFLGFWILGELVLFKAEHFKEAKNFTLCTKVIFDM